MPSDSLANRYGRPQRTGSPARRRRGVWIAVLALIAAVAVTVWFTVSAHSRTLDWQDVGFTIDSPTQASVTFQLTKDPEDTVQCAVQVLSPEFAVVGWRTVTIGPETPTSAALPSDRQLTYEVDLRTDSLGTNGGVNDCWFPED